MYLTLPFILKQQDEQTATYEEEVQSGTSPVIGSLSVRKSALSPHPPSVMRVALSYGAARPAPTHPPGVDVPRWADFDEKPLEAKERVTVVKNRHGTLASPPEWLQQYVGQTGAVLWTTPSGAMVDLSGSATWFPYAELEREGPRPIARDVAQE
jgi:hypothetical protein